MVRAVRATQLELDTAVQALRDGDVVAFPTETVYGLGANAQDARGVRRIFELKGRPATHPLIVHLDSPRFLARGGPASSPSARAGRCPPRWSCTWTARGSCRAGSGKGLRRPRTWPRASG